MLYMPFFSIFAFKKALQLHWKEKFDLIHGNWNCDWFFKKKYFNVPIISTMHGTWIGEYNGVLSQPLKYSRLNDLFIRIFGKIFGRIDKKVAKKTDKLIVVSQFSKKEVLKYYKIPEDKIIVIPNGVDNKIFSIQNRKQKLKKKTFNLLFVGRLVARKAPQYLIEALPLIIKEIPNVKLIIIGSGPLKGVLLKRIKQLGLTGKVSIFSGVPINILAKIYAISDLFIFHSFYEAQGIVLLEAMSSGVPIIGTKIGGIPDTIIHNKCGMLIKPGDPKSISNAVINLYKNKSKMDKFVKNGLERIEKNYLWHNLAKKIEKIYLEQISKQKNNNKN